MLKYSHGSTIYDVRFDVIKPDDVRKSTSPLNVDQCRKKSFVNTICRDKQVHMVHASIFDWQLQQNSGSDGQITLVFGNAIIINTANWKYSLNTDWK